MTKKIKMYTKKHHHKRRVAEAEEKSEAARKQRELDRKVNDAQTDAMMKGIRDAVR